MSLETATIKSIQNAIKDHFDPQGIENNHEKFKLKQHICKHHNPKDIDPTTDLEKFARALHHGHKRLNKTEDAIELFNILKLDAEKLPQRETNKKASGLASIIIPGLLGMFNADPVAQVSIHMVKGDAKFRSKEGWKNFFASYNETRKGFEQLSEDLFEFAEVEPGDLDGVENKILKLFPTYREDVGQFDWTQRKTWVDAEHNLRQSIGK